MLKYFVSGEFLTQTALNFWNFWRKYSKILRKWRALSFKIVFIWQLTVKFGGLTPTILLYQKCIFRWAMDNSFSKIFSGEGDTPPPAKCAARFARRLHFAITLAIHTFSPGVGGHSDSSLSLGFSLPHWLWKLIALAGPPPPPPLTPEAHKRSNWKMLENAQRSEKSALRHYMCLNNAFRCLICCVYRFSGSRNTLQMVSKLFHAPEHVISDFIFWGEGG